MSRLTKIFEALEDNLDQMEAEDPHQQLPDAEQPNGDQELTSEGELFYIQNLVDAALYEPSPDEKATLLDIQDVLKNKQYTSARDEVLPTILSIIQDPQTKEDLGNVLKEI